ncbi:hypothetical protein V6N12_021078 [Hibiscus sabdariffa]|uniref:Uncharacterized protein n=1 Tax=Hibiscus sabdariffa TaxID=183260 RepID=A0ABR2B3L0_9ROSI
MAMAVWKVYEELDEVKVENKKLRVDLKSKAELREHLKKIQNDMLTKIQEASSKTEKQAEQISAVKQANEDLKHEANEKNLDLEQNINVLRAEIKEECMRKVEDKLKWKKEPFKYLEEAHDKLRDQFMMSKNEWE